MLTITKPSLNRLDIDFSGTMDAAMMRLALEDLLAESKGITNGRMLYRIPDFSMPTAGALAVELQMLPKLFGLIGKFERCAVLSDESWIRTAAEIEGALLPGITIKSFHLSEEDAAEAWLAED